MKLKLLVKMIRQRMKATRRSDGVVLLRGKGVGVEVITIDTLPPERAKRKAARPGNALLG